ncbi:hypothetical protein ZEAMMB73_Zm00001d043673 [Zea mays]|uniref:Uncharacterized protein n=1 Tax=Zea mays TaxID=4577 RepID=A0A1D6NE75_MAIZE|nr:hypothetical protein ZEAMMB73_Zm00001d043673 [Zea mays]
MKSPLIPPACRRHRHVIISALLASSPSSCNHISSPGAGAGSCHRLPLETVDDTSRYNCFEPGTVVLWSSTT